MEKSRSSRTSLFWFKRPITMIKGILGWKLNEEIPWWSIFAVLLEFTIFFYILTTIIHILGIIKVHASLTQLITGMPSGIELSFFLAVSLVAWIFVILYIFKKILHK